MPVAGAGPEDPGSVHPGEGLMMSARPSRAGTRWRLRLLVPAVLAPLLLAGALAPGAAAGPRSVAAAVRPGRGTTGVPAGTVLRPYYGNLTITTPGAVYDRLDIHGFVTVKAPGARITRSIVRGGVATGNIGLVTNTTPSATGFVISDSELVPEHPSVWLDALKGSNYTALRVDAHGTVDTAKVYGDNVRIEASWLHDTRYYPSDPNQGGGPTHNDGVQVLGGRNIRILGNTITGARNAALMVTQDYSATTDLVFSGNFADDGWCSVNLNNKPLPRMGGITVTGNRFGGHDTFTNCAIIATHATALTATGNVWDATGRPVVIRNGG